jgi:hypothetical protein
MILETFFLAEENTAMRANFFRDLFFYQAYVPDVIDDAPGADRKLVEAALPHSG